MIKDMWDEVYSLISEGKIVSAWALSVGGVAEGVCKMAIGNDVGFAFDEGFPADALFLKNFGGILVEAAQELPARPGRSATPPRGSPSRSAARA